MGTGSKGQIKRFEKLWENWTSLKHKDMVPAELSTISKEARFFSMDNRKDAMGTCQELARCPSTAKSKQIRRLFIEKSVPLGHYDLTPNEVISQRLFHHVDLPGALSLLTLAADFGVVYLMLALQTYRKLESKSSRFYSDFKGRLRSETMCIESS